MNLNNGKSLVEKWEPILEGISDEYTKETTAVLLENQAAHILTEASKEGMLNETPIAGDAGATTVGHIGTFQKFAFPLVRRVFPELIANKVVSVQPMQGPVSQVFYLGYDRSHVGNSERVYGKYNLTWGNRTASAIGAMQGMDDAYAASSGGYSWSGHGIGGSDNASAVSAGQFTETMGKQIAAFPSSTQLTQFNTASGEALAGHQIPEITFHIEQQAVIARTRKFRALWTIEAAQDLKAYHNLDLERELTDLLGKEVALEIDREILEDLRMLAYDVNPNAMGDLSNGFIRGNGINMANPNSMPQDHDWTPGAFTYNDSGSLTGNPAGTDKNVYFCDFAATNNLGLSPRHVGQVYSNLVAIVNFAAQDIYKTTFRGAGNYLITSPLVAAMLHSASKLEGGVAPEEAGSLGANISYKGKWLGMYDIYVDPMWPEDEILVGYKGGNSMEGGYVYAPYIPIQMLPTVVNPENFQPRKGLLTRYGKASVTPESRWYRIIRLVGADSRYMTQPFAKVVDSWNEAGTNSTFQA